MTRWYLPYARREGKHVWLYGTPFAGFRLTADQARALAAQLNEHADAAQGETPRRQVRAS